MQLGDIYKWEKKGEHPKPGSTILFLDGGGIRGLLSIEILMDIEARTEKRIIDLFDWIVGTSTGRIIALALVYGKKGEGGREEGRKGRREGAREGVRDGAREGGREEGKEGERKGGGGKERELWAKGEIHNFIFQVV